MEIQAQQTGELQQKFMHSLPVNQLPENIKSLQKEDVYPVYKELYWDRIKGDDLPDRVDWTKFDFCVNSGVSWAAKALQGIVSATKDGAIGDRTLAAVEQKDSKQIIDEMHDLRQDFLEELSTFKHYGRGWTTRNAHVKDTALDMVWLPQNRW